MAIKLGMEAKLLFKVGGQGAAVPGRRWATRVT
jgi:hypothetical protein